jgi:hypothetical protein
LAISLRYIFIFSLVLLTAPSTCLALYLGEPVVKSSLRQPLRAEIEIVGGTQAELDALAVGLASQDTFASRGLSRPPLVNELVFSVGQSAGDGKPVIHVTTVTPVDEPDVVFLIEAFWPGAELLQEISLQVESAQTESDAGISIEYELDAYYTNIGAYIPLTDAEMKEVEVGDETLIYRELLANAFIPRFFLVEASVNPLPVLGVYIKEDHESFYDRAEITDDVNLIDALTEGFEEPYALSFFVGNVIRFTSAISI